MFDTFKIIYCIALYSTKWQRHELITRHKAEILRGSVLNLKIVTLNAFPMQFHSAGGLCDASWIGYNCIKISV